MATADQLATQQLIDQLLSNRGGGLSGANMPIPNLSPTGPTSQFPRVMPSTSTALVHMPGLGSSGPSSFANPIEQMVGQVTGSGMKAKAAGLMGGASGVMGKTSPFGKLLSTTKGKIGVGLGLPIAGNFLGDMAGGDESILGRALKGAGTGGGIGAIGGPWGAAGGALVGGLGNALFGGGGGSKKSNITELLSNAPLTPEARDRLQLTYEILKETSDEKTAGATIGQMILEELNAGAAEAKATEDSQRRMLATQALTAQFFQPFTKELLDSAQMRYKMTQDLLPSLPESYRGIAAQQSIAALDDSTRLANAYASQAQLIPTMSAMQQQQSGVNQIAQQLFQQSLANTGTGGAGAGSFNDLLAQLGTGQ